MVDKRNSSVTTPVQPRGDNFMDRIRKTLAIEGITDDAAIADILCRAANASPSTVARWMGDEVTQRPSEGQFSSIAKELGIQREYLTSGKIVQTNVEDGASNEAVSSRIRYLIDQHPMYSWPGGSRSDLARNLGVTRQSVQRWTDGSSMPRGKNLLHLAQALGTTPTFIQYGTNKLDREELDSSFILLSAVPTEEDGCYIAHIERADLDASAPILVVIPCEGREQHLVAVPRKLVADRSKMHHGFGLIIHREDDDYTIGTHKNTRVRTLPPLVL